MTALTFNPRIFTVTTHSGSNICTWDLLTLEGETPNETIYFLHKNDAPSHNQQNEIVKAIDNEDWVEQSISEEDVILNYSIDVTIFDATGGAYDNIINRLNELQERF